MAGLTYGLNITKKSSSHRPPAARRKAVFDDDSGSDEGPTPDAPQAIDSLGGLSSAPVSKSLESARPSTHNDRSSTRTPKKGISQISQHGDLATNHSTTKRVISAHSVDSTIYDYDSVYDSLHAKPKSLAFDDKRPKYMGNLLAAAEVRKRDQLRAKEKLLAKEREAEGEEFVDKEKFVTEAYKAQREEIKRMEEEEENREKEEMARKRKGGGGMTGLYKGLLEREAQRHEEILMAANEGVSTRDTVEVSEEQTLGDTAREMGAVVNENGQIVDKRQLLSAGLNVVPKAKSAASTRDNNSAQGSAKSDLPATLHGRDRKQAMRERQSRMLEAQLEQASKRAADDENVREEALERAAKSRKTVGDISSAKERYLQRKREAAAAAGGTA